MGWRILFLNPFLQLKEGFEFASTPNATITEFTLHVLAKFFFCLLLLPLWKYVIVLCFVVRYFMSILVLQSS